MNSETTFEDADKIEFSGRALPRNSGLEDLHTFSQKLENLNYALDQLIEIGDENTKKRAAGLKAKLAAFEPSVTMIGQVKAGKTSLLNAMVGWPDLLPADVNPWTSVVTSLHLSPEKKTSDATAKFRFFESDEWTKFLDKGGRLGELASRAGADEELEKVRQQIEIMREKSRTRLGKKFELLLGQEHEYGYFDKDLIEKYVCLGDFFDGDEEGDVPDTQGRFADITKSADLFLHRDEVPINLCIRDTPGVNDTFMMREQITIRAIRDSRICVVVLSAHQALSSVDMAIIRMISNIKSREVVIFVNRIDELPNPEQQVPEIRESILRTLKAHSGPEDTQIIFGSALWANKSLTGDLESLDADSAASAANWADVALADSAAPASGTEMMWELSGIPALYRALSERIVEGAGRDEIEKISHSAINLANGVRLADAATVKGTGSSTAFQLDKSDVTEDLDKIEEESLQLLDSELEKLVTNFHSRLDKSHKSFLDRATSSLVTHLETKGEREVWEYSPMGLRMMLHSAYLVFGTRIQKSATKVFKASATNISDLYTRAFDGSVESIDIQLPSGPHIPPPVFLGQTIALDLKGPWWKSWWTKRKGRQAFAESFHRMIKEETDPIVDELKSAQSDSIHRELVGIVKEFFADQRAILENVAGQSSVSCSDIEDIFNGKNAIDRRKILETTLATLTATRPEQEMSSVKMAPDVPDIKPIQPPAIKPRIALMGEFSSGKSTLSNLLLGADPLPTKVTATQLPPVWISHGDDPSSYEDMEGNVIPVDLDALAEVPLENARLIRLFFKSEILELCDLIDMPGISDPNMSSDVWMRVIHEADSVIWCTPATQSWRQSEAAVWEMLPSELHSKSLLLVTRFDKLTDEDDRKKVLKRIRRETKGLFSDVFPVSLTQAISAHDDEEIWDNSGADAFVRRFVDLLGELEHLEQTPPQQPVIEIDAETAETLEIHCSNIEKTVAEDSPTPEMVMPERIIAKPKRGGKTQRPPRRPREQTFKENSMEEMREV